MSQYREKIIFLDIDGVLNSNSFFQSDEYEKLDRWVSMIDEKAVELLNDLIKETNAKIVISSTWRKSLNKEELLEILKSKGFEYDILDYTPYLVFRDLDYVKGSVPRGCEIQAWLNHNYSHPDSVNYIIFDDDSDMLLSQTQRFIWVDGWHGLTPNLTYKAKRILTN
jgi:hypothetical protein